MNIELTEREIMFLKQYAQVYKQERSIDCTADPIVVVEDVDYLVAGDGFGDKTVYAWDDEEYNSLEELKEDLKENGFSENDIEAFCEDLDDFGICKNNEIQKYSVHRIYKPIAYFLTRAEADRYVEYQSHNLKEPRVYTRYCGYANSGDLQCLYKLLLRIGKQLNETAKGLSWLERVLSE